METTSLYVELSIIGLETMIWIGSFTAFFADDIDLRVMAGTLEKLPLSLLMLGVMYITGIIFDRFADGLFLKFEKNIRNGANLETESSILYGKQTTRSLILISHGLKSVSCVHLS